MSSEQGVTEDLALQHEPEHLASLHTALSLRRAVRQCHGLAVNPSIGIHDVCAAGPESIVPEDLYKFPSLLMFEKPQEIKLDTEVQNSEPGVNLSRGHICHGGRGVSKIYGH